MGYQKPTTYQKNTTAQAAATAPAATAAPAQAAPADAVTQNRKPVGTLYVQRPGEETKEKIAGLFKETSKNGQVYYRGKAADGSKFLMFVD